MLNQNNEWRSRYDMYAQRITQNLNTIISVRASFRQWKPLTVYLNTTSAMNARKTVVFDLRYLGQAVASLTGYLSGNNKLSTNAKRNLTNLRDFGCGIQLVSADWNGSDAAKFREYFSKRKGPRNSIGNKGNEEHRLESLWLTELLKPGGKILPNTRAVTIGKVRFPMPTPISASNHEGVKYSGISGGGIDILARTGIGGRNTYLCIMEVKDENVKKEPPKEALKQAVSYATFIRELLRSDGGQQWWNLFGFKGKVPGQLTLLVACVMPSSPFNDYSFKDLILNIDDDFIKLHYIYFNENNSKLSSVDTSLIWS